MISVMVHIIIVLSLCYQVSPKFIKSSLQADYSPIYENKTFFIYINLEIHLVEIQLMQC